MVGSLSARELVPLSHEFEEFVNSSRDQGFIIVSFGSNVAALSKAKVDMLATAFGKLRQRVVWRLKGKPFDIETLTNNVPSKNPVSLACDKS